MPDFSDELMDRTGQRYKVCSAPCRMWRGDARAPVTSSDIIVYCLASPAKCCGGGGAGTISVVTGECPMKLWDQK